MGVLDTASSANRRIPSESLRKISFRILSDLARLVTVGSGHAERSRKYPERAPRKPLKVYEVMKRANIVNEEICQSPPVEDARRRVGEVRYSQRPMVIG